MVVKNVHLWWWCISWCKVYIVFNVHKSGWRWVKLSLHNLLLLRVLFVCSFGQAGQYVTSMPYSQAMVVCAISPWCWPQCPRCLVVSAGGREGQIPQCGVRYLMADVLTLQVKAGCAHVVACCTVSRSIDQVFWICIHTLLNSNNCYAHFQC